MRERHQKRHGLAGFTLIELTIVLALIGVVMAIGVTNFNTFMENQRASSSARDVADAFSLARSEAIRTGNNVIVAFRVETGLAGISSDIVIANDGSPAAANCALASSEIIRTFALERNVRFGTTTTLSNTTAAPDDGGTSGHQTTGSSFANGSSPAGVASWVMFSPDGMPHRFTQDGTAPCDNVSAVGAASGAIYLTNGRRDYAVVLSPLGTSRLHRWNKGSWTL